MRIVDEIRNLECVKPILKFKFVLITRSLSLIRNEANYEYGLSWKYFSYASIVG